MECFANRILELLGYSERDNEFDKFVRDLEGSPVFKYQTSKLCVHLWYELGVALFSARTKFFSVQFYLQSSEFNDVVVSPYRDLLPFGLGAEYGLNDVHQLLGPPKLGVYVHGANRSEEYFLEPLNVVFCYSLVDDKLVQITVVSPAACERAEEEP